MSEVFKKYINRRLLRGENLNAKNRVGLTTKIDESDPYRRIIKLSYRGEEVGYAELLPDGENQYIANYFYIFNDKRGNDFGSNLVDAVNNFLDERGASAKLANHIANPFKMGMYKRHGWKSRIIGGQGWLYYTPKKGK